MREYAQHESCANNEAGHLDIPNKFVHINLDTIKTKIVSMVSILEIMQRRQQLKKRILDRASHFFFEIGYSSVTTADIASEVGISKKTLYKLFSSKLMLLRSVIRREIRLVAAKLEAILNDQDADFYMKIKGIFGLASHQIVKMSRVFRRDVFRSAPEIWEEIDKFRRRFFLKRLGSLISEGVKEGIVRGDIDERLIILLHQLVMENVVNPEQLFRLSINPLDIKESST